MDINHALKEIAHHAYLFIGNESLQSELVHFVSKKFEMKTAANGDFFESSFPNLTIAEARKIKELHDIRPVDQSGKKIFIMHFDNATVEAQNALLKLLEEPAEYAHFFIIVPSPHILLPTVKSRLLFVSYDHKTADKSSAEEAKKFLKSSPAQRIEMIKKLTDDISKEKRPRRDAIDLLYSIEKILYKEQGAQKAAKELETIQTSLKYINDRAPSLKMLLEYVALNI